MKDTQQTVWFEQQERLQVELTSPTNVSDAIDLFLQQHGMLHAAALTPDLTYHFQDDVLNEFPHSYWRIIPANEDHSIVWLFWHLTRIEDATLSMLIANEDPLFEKEGWQEKLGIRFTDPGNAMSPEEIQQLSDEMNIDELLKYREAVARQTRKIVQSLTSDALQKKGSVDQLERMKEIGVVREADQWLLDFWGGLTAAGLLLMPPTNHTMYHINEAQDIKEKIYEWMEKQEK